ncbi:MAG: hypothetical protein ACFFER_04615 [Candidatus Thorarchaeota archaeon]
MSSPQSEADAYTVNITAHGGKKEDVEASVKDPLVGSEQESVWPWALPRTF